MKEERKKPTRNTGEINEKGKVGMKEGNKAKPTRNREEIKERKMGVKRKIYRKVKEGKT